MALRGHVFSQQLFSSDCFALFIDTFLGGECGVIKGLDMTHDTSSITVDTGYFCVQGRFLEEESGITFNVDTTEDTTYHILAVEIDLSKTNTKTLFAQGYYKTVSSTEGWPELIQNNIGEGIYQFALCRYTTDSNGVSNFRDLREYLDFDSIYTDVRTQIGNAIEDAEDDFETWFSAFQNTSSSSFSEWMEESEETFTDWFDHLQDVLDENTAAHLLNLINQNTEDISNLQENKADNKKNWNIALDTTWSETLVYELTEDVAIDSEKTYYTLEDGVYIEVDNPVVEDITTYYEITGTTLPYSKTVEVEGIKSTDIVNMYPIYSDTLETRLAEKDEYNKISMIHSANGSVTITCDEEAPEMALNVRLEVLY